MVIADIPAENPLDDDKHKVIGFLLIFCCAAEDDLRDFRMSKQA